MTQNKMWEQAVVVVAVTLLCTARVNASKVTIPTIEELASQLSQLQTIMLEQKQGNNSRLQKKVELLEQKHINISKLEAKVGALEQIHGELISNPGKVHQHSLGEIQVEGLLHMNDVKALKQAQSHLQAKVQNLEISQGLANQLTKFEQKLGIVGEIQVEIQAIKESRAQLKEEVEMLEKENVKLNNKVEDLVKSQATNVAFSVHMSTFNVTGIASRQRIEFDQVDMNNGEGYHPASGIFNCPVSGNYIFFLHSHVRPGISVSLDIMKAGSTQARVYCRTHNPTMTHTAFHVNAGEEVWVQQYMGSELYGFIWTRFTGLLVRAD